MLKKSLAVIALLLPLSFSVIANDMGPGKININEATAETLDKKLKFVGPNTAKKIVEFREKNGKFKSVEGLAEVKGVGMQVIKANRSLLSVE